MTRPDFVTYDGLPAASGGAHALRMRRPAAAYERVDAFVTQCTLPEGDTSFVFRLWAGGTADRTARWQEWATAVLGGVRRTQPSYREWNVRADDVVTVLEELATADAEDVTRHGGSLVALSRSTAVRLRDPATGEAYVDVDAAASGGFAADGYGRVLGASGVRATFGSAASTISLWLSFPGDERLASAAGHVQAHAPVRLSAKHWRRWSPTRGDGYRSARISSPLA
ncbi:hypothetical protein [Microbacterium gorillae]|uniref:hypothetical protein n=1 Tax=Microbacterium gorillae TaxID=1231063 RepID=UPI003D9824E9